MKKLEIRKVKQGDFFKLSENGKVYVRGYYERSCKRYEAYLYDDVNHESFFKGSRIVLIDLDDSDF